MTHRTPKAAAGGWGSSLRPQTQHVGQPEAWWGAQPTEVLQRPVQTGEGRPPAGRTQPRAAATAVRELSLQDLLFSGEGPTIPLKHGISVYTHGRRQVHVAKDSDVLLVKSRI